MSSKVLKLKKIECVLLANKIRCFSFLLESAMEMFKKEMLNLSRKRLLWACISFHKVFVYLFLRLDTYLCTQIKNYLMLNF